MRHGIEYGTDSVFSLRLYDVLDMLEQSSYRQLGTHDTNGKL